MFTNKPIWVEEWPLTKENLLALQQLIQEQLSPGHIEGSVSPWNFPVLLLRKKLGK